MPAKLQSLRHEVDEQIESAVRFTMDLFYYVTDYQTWICIPCGMGVKPLHYLRHLIKWHANQSEVKASKKAKLLLVEELMLKDSSDPDLPGFQLPRPGQLALPHLPIHEGWSCLTCSYTCLATRTMERHQQNQHEEHRRRPGRRNKVEASPGAARHRLQALHFEAGITNVSLRSFRQQSVAAKLEMAQCRQSMEALAKYWGHPVI
jgi:hypothetical protein